MLGVSESFCGCFHRILHSVHPTSPEAPGHIKFLIPPSEVLRQHFLPTESISQVQWVQEPIALHIVPLEIKIYLIEHQGMSGKAAFRTFYGYSDIRLYK